MGRAVSSLLGPFAGLCIHFYVSLIPIDVGDDCWSNTTPTSEAGILPQCPSGKRRGIERMISPLKSYLMHILSPGTNHAGGLGCFHSGTTMKVLCIFFPFGGKMMALLS